MSSPAPTPPTPVVTVQGSVATPHWMTIMGSIMAALNAGIPMVLNVLPPKVAGGIQLGIAVEPVVISVIQAIQSL